MNEINIIITVRNSDSGGSVIARTTDNRVILDRCDSLPEDAFNKTSSSIFYCISNQNSGLLIQQIRCTTAGRSGTYNVLGIVIPRGKIISSPICPIFNKINEIYQNTPSGGKLDNLLLDYAKEVAIEDYLDHDMFAQDNSFAYRIIDNDIENVLHNPIQAEYKKYEYILLVDSNDKICTLSECRRLSNTIDSKTRYAVNCQYINGIDFRPKVSSFECYSAELSTKSIIYTAPGFMDVEKKYNEKITAGDVYYKISRSEIETDPSHANVKCNIVNCEDGIFMIPYTKSDSVLFTIEIDGYNSKKVSFDDLRSGKVIQLTPCEEESSLQVYNSDKLIHISYRSIEKPNFSMEDAMIAPSFLEKEFNRLKKWRFVLLIVCLIIFILGFAVGHYMPTSPNQSAEGYASDTIEVDRDYQKKQSIEKYLASDKWNTTNIAELNGLFNAMDRFSYVDIEKKYNALKQNYNVGELQKVIDEIKKYNDIRKPTANYTILKKTTEIDISKWVEEVETVNCVSSSHQITEKEMIEHYLSQDFWRKGKCSERVEKTGRTKEPEGLWEAMRTYNFETIKNIYDQLTQEGYQVGNLKKVIEAIDSHSPVSSPLLTNYGNLGSNISIGQGPIDINNWINSLKPNQKQCPICKKMVEEQKYTSHYNACRGD